MITIGPKLEGEGPASGYKNCPFCGTYLRDYASEGRHTAFHPRVDCILDGKGISRDEQYKWNTRW